MYSKHSATTTEGEMGNNMKEMNAKERPSLECVCAVVMSGRNTTLLVVVTLINKGDLTPMTTRKLFLDLMPSPDLDLRKRPE